MIQSRRRFLASTGAGAALGATALAGTRSTAKKNLRRVAKEVIDLFEPLPGVKAVKIWAPAEKRRREFLAELNPERRMFIASSFKGFVLGEALRQADAPDVIRTLATTDLELNESVFSLGSPVFNPPNLTGVVSERTTLEAMISHSDNTATDMALKHVGPDAVRSFISSIGLQNTMIPDSTREYLGYIFGAPNPETITWDEVLALLDSGSPVHPLLNDVQTMASTPDDLVSFYSRALQGEFFENDATLTEFRRILTMAETIALVIPLGVKGFLKGGSIDAGGSHGLALAGGMFVDPRWAYFATIINWDSPAEADPETAGAFAAAVTQAFSLVAEALGD